MTLDHPTLAQLAEYVENAELNAHDISKITDDHPEMDWDDAYAIQDLIRQRKIARGKGIGPPQREFQIDIGRPAPDPRQRGQPRDHLVIGQIAQRVPIDSRLCDAAQKVALIVLGKNFGQVHVGFGHRGPP